MDVVYFVRPGDDNPELRYSLRSLENIDHDDVWVVGHKPAWVKNVRRIPYEADRNLSKWENVTAATRLAVDTLPAEWALFNDDFFAVRPTTIPLWYSGRLKTVDRPGNGATWRSGKYQTAQLLQSWGCDILDYELHVPMPVVNDGMREALSRTNGRIVALQRRSLYGNYLKVGGELHSDVAVGQTGTWRERWEWVATNDVSFRTGDVGRRIRDLFPGPSPFEKKAQPAPQTRSERLVSKKAEAIEEDSMGPRYQHKKDRIVARRVRRNKPDRVQFEDGTWADVTTIDQPTETQVDISSLDEPTDEGVDTTTVSTTCDTCGFVAKSAGGLTSHQRTHKDE